MFNCVYRSTKSLILPHALAASHRRPGARPSSSVPFSTAACWLHPYYDSFLVWNALEQILIYNILSIWFSAQAVVLGTVVQEERSTLLECAVNKDADRDDHDHDENECKKHKVRNDILFACISKYINSHSQEAKAWNKISQWWLCGNPTHFNTMWS